MKRNMNLMREILLRIEDTDERTSPPDFSIDGFSEPEIDYNLDLLINAGLVNGTGQWTFGGTYHVAINGLTWPGHDFLDSVRDKVVWAKVQEKAEEAGHTVASLTIDLVKGLATSVLKSQLGLGI